MRCLDELREQHEVQVLTLAVSSDQLAAKQLYESVGFTVFGPEPDACRVGEERIAEDHMALRLRR